MLLHVSVILSTGEGGGFPADITGHMTNFQGGRGLHFGWVQTPTPGTRKAGGTYPTGMLSCFPCMELTK